MSYTYYNDNDEYGGYQFIPLEKIINDFMFVYVGEDKIISKAKRTDVLFHAKRAMRELSYDTLKSFKSKELLLPPSLTIKLPPDYVNYTKISSVDSAGIKHRLYPTLSKTSNPNQTFLQNEDGDFKLQIKATFNQNSSLIRLDGIHPNISLAGLIVESPQISLIGDFFVIKTHTISSNNSVITLNDKVDGTGRTFVSNNASSELITIRQDKSINLGLINRREDGVRLQDCTVSITDPKKIVSTNDVNDVKVGMIVNSSNVVGDEFPVETRVTQVDIDNKTIFVDKNVLSAITNEDLFFVGLESDSTTWSNYKSHTPSINSSTDFDYDDKILEQNIGQRYGLDPQHAQINGSYYIDDNTGLIHFSSNLSGSTIVLDYITDGLSVTEENKIHKFAEDAIYKSIAYGIISSSRFLQPLAPRYKKEKFAAVRQAKLRLSNIKLEEITQVLRGKSKRIKH